MKIQILIVLLVISMLLLGCTQEQTINVDNNTNDTNTNNTNTNITSENQILEQEINQDWINENEVIDTGSVI